MSLKLKHISFPLKELKVIQSNIEEAMIMCFNNISFSTYPYILYKITNSSDSLRQYNSGNCIALSMFIQTYLSNNYNYNCYIIPASVPSIFRVEGTNNICHVSVCIPIDKDKCFIIDPAFYFLKPMLCIYGMNKSTIESCNIHTNENEKITYLLQDSNYNGILPNSKECKCYFDHLPNDTWCYYLNEILNPDESIGSIYIKCKPYPFLCNTKYDNKTNKVKKKFHIKTDENGDFIIIKDCEEIFKGNPEKMPRYIQKMIQLKLFKYFSNYIV